MASKAKMASMAKMKHVQLHMSILFTLLFLELSGAVDSPIESAYTRPPEVQHAHDELIYWADLYDLGECLNKHEFAIWARVSFSEECEPLMMAIEGGDLNVGLEMVKNLTKLEELLLSDSQMHQFCSDLKSLVYPCLNDLISDIMSILRDSKYCKPISRNIPERFDKHSLIKMLENLANLVCTESQPETFEALRVGLSDGRTPEERASVEVSSQSSQEVVERVLPMKTSHGLGKLLRSGYRGNGNWEEAGNAESGDSSSAKYCAGLVVAPVLDDYLHHRKLTEWLSCSKSEPVFRCCGRYVQRLVQAAGVFSSLLDEFHVEYNGIPGSIILEYLQTRLGMCSFAGQCHAPTYPKPKSPIPIPTIQPAPTIPKRLPSEPQQIHLAFAGDDGKGVSNAMAVTWVTFEPTTTEVRFGKDKSSLTEIVMGMSTSFDNIGDILDGDRVIKVHATFDHKVVLENLDSSTTYYYQIINNVTKSAVLSFESAPKTNSSGPFNLAVIGDMGIFESANTKKQLDKLDDSVDFYYHLGDIGYADDWFLHDATSFGYQNVWDTFLQWIENLSSRKPYMVLPGNHESENHSPLYGIKYDKIKSTFSNFSTYNNRFRMPFKESKSGTNMWYSFNYGPVHFISINTETDFPGNPEDNYTGLPVGGFGDQMSWLKEDLQQAVRYRDVRPWIIVAGHRPMYSIEPGSSKDGKAVGVPANIQAAFEDLFITHQVDIYFSGHMHSYERQSPICANEEDASSCTSSHCQDDDAAAGCVRSVCNLPKCPIHIINGAAGNSEFHTKQPPMSERPSWSIAAEAKHYGYGVLTIFNETTLRWGFMESDSGRLLDELILRKDSGGFAGTGKIVWGHLSREYHVSEVE